MAPGRQIAACLILVLVALSIVACGNDSTQGAEIPKTTADALITKLDEVKVRAADSSKTCGDNSAQTSLASVQDAVDQLSNDNVDPQIVSDLRELIDNVRQQLTDQCAAIAASAGSTATETATTSTATTPTKDSTDTSTTSTETTPTSTSTSTSTDTTTPPGVTQTGTTPPGGSNGNGNGGTHGGFEAGGTAPGSGRAVPNGGDR